jgi:hypothetical protein
MGLTGWMAMPECVKGQLPTFWTLCGDLEKTSIGLAGGSSRIEDQQTWFDNVCFEPLE